MNNLKVYPFEEKHLDSILSIENMSFKEAWSRESMEKELNNNYAKYIVITYENNVIGYGGMWLILDEGHITNIAVHPEFRGIGAGKLIVQSLIDICKRNAVTSLTLEVRLSNHIAQKLYSSFGFISEGIRKRYYADNNEDAVIMWKKGI